MSAISFEISGAQIDGARDYQEDAFLISHLRDDQGRASYLLVVADGMGGHAAGNVASNMAAGTANTYVSANYPSPEITSVLRQSALTANAAIREAVSETTALEGMGCTMVGALLDARGLWWVSAGDSHLYIIRNRKLVKLNEDHSYGGFLKRMKQQGKNIKREKGMRDNMLMTALTGDELTELDCPEEPKELKPGDRVILCSDGLDTLTHGKLIQISQTSKDPRGCAYALLDAVEETKKPKQDNTTVVVADVIEGVEQGGAGAAARASVRQSKAIAMAEAVELRKKFGGQSRSISRTGGSSQGAKIGTVILALALVGAGAVGGYLYYQQRIAPKPAPVVETPSPTPTVQPTAPEAKPPKIDLTVPTLDGPPPQVNDTLADGTHAPLLALIPGGGFRMGEGSSGNLAETPEHPVSVASFAMGVYEVTSGQYRAFMQATGHSGPAAPLSENPQEPVHGVSWNDAVAYTEWLQAQTGLPYRLPSEAEWEYASSAGLEFSYAWGPTIGDKRALCRLDCGWPPFEITRPMPVGSFDPNPFGLRDTAGNVAEWTADCWNLSYQGAPNDGSAWTQGDCALRVVRGGSFESPAKSLRTAYRTYIEAHTRISSYGLRVARDLTATEQQLLQDVLAKAAMPKDEATPEAGTQAPADDTTQ